MDAIWEDLRQICIIREYSIDYWWKYMMAYEPTCILESLIEECSNAAMEKAEIIPQVINECIQSSFDTINPNECTKNTLLEREGEILMSDRVYVFPDIKINNFTYRVTL